MKLPATSFLLLAFAGVATADTPRKEPLQSYSVLWNNSPFTSKPPPPEQGPVSNPLDDYALIGVSPIGGKNYRVTMINKKTPEERIMIYSDRKGSEFEILEVIRKAGDPLGTEVKMKNGSSTGTVTYEEKLLTLVAPAAAKPPVQPQIPGLPPGVPGQPLVQPGQVRQPRPRVVPPPIPTQTPAPQQAVPQPPGQGIPQNTARPQRRRN